MGRGAWGGDAVCGGGRGERGVWGRGRASTDLQTFSIFCAAAMTIFLNLGAYRIPPETGLLIPSVYNIYLSFDASQHS